MLHVQNQTTNIVLVDRGRVADSYWSKLKGLIGVRELAKGDGLLIKPCKGVHCMFMSIPIDVLYLDKDDQVIGFDADMRPWAIGRVYPDSSSVLELPSGTIARTATKPGDQLEIRML